MKTSVKNSDGIEKLPFLLKFWMLNVKYKLKYQ